MILSTRNQDVQEFDELLKDGSETRREERLEDIQLTS